MKRIFLFFSLLAGLMACNRELPLDVKNPTSEGMVTFTFNVSVPDAPMETRSFAAPEIENLYLIVFDNNGYYAEKCEATPVDSWTISTETVTEFKVTLTASATKRTIHFIANYTGPDQLAFGSESDVIGVMYNSGGQDAYWQRMEFDGGINDDTEIGTVPLIRNHARITVTNQDDQFTLIGFSLVNTLTEGYVSPYNKNTGNFAKFIEQNESGFVKTEGKYVCRSYADITAGQEGYEGYVPATTELNLDTSLPDPYTTTASDWTAPGEFVYTYERCFEETDRMVLLVYGSYGKATATYYKVDLINTVDGVSSYYNILRNFQYNIVITDVTGNGKKSPQLAYEMTGAHNNLSASVETQSLTNISDGYSRLFVEYTEEYIVSSSPVTLNYKYVPDIAQETTYSNGSVSVYQQTGDVISGLVNNSSTVDNEGWSKITITPNAPDPDEAKKQSITLVAGALSRTVTYVLRSPFELDMTCYDGAGTELTDKVVNAAVGSKLNVQIDLPTALPESIFPLELYIEAEEKTLYPDASQNQIPVETDIPSLFDGGETFGFTYEISWDQYCNVNAAGDVTGYNTSYTAKFLTNTAVNASRVRIYNKYFSTEDDFFANSSFTFGKMTINGVTPSDNTDITIRYHADGTVLGVVSYAQLKAGVTVPMWVDTSDQNTNFCYFTYFVNGVEYRTQGTLQVSQAKSGSTLNSALVE